ncbi:unnamed protein product [Protopolystoma xenopodis]|uniref:Uncharacterized protein n=1 Tax=Protopolystoma xenopodis TaxID=117903 RepID=A0A3S5AKQ7_9PLAT|nr:unnamed protein product [Protopolystoma xenopodis]
MSSGRQSAGPETKDQSPLGVQLPVIGCSTAGVADGNHRGWTIGNLCGFALTSSFVRNTECQAVLSTGQA